MNTRKMMTALIAGLALSTAAVYAAGDEPGTSPDRPHREHMRHGARLSIERVAIGNALSAELSTRTGKPATEISAMLKEQGPRETAEALGIDRDTMKAAMQTAHQSVIDKAVAAQLITAEQAVALSEAHAKRAAHRSERKQRDKDADQAKDSGL
jgi:Spy/CpxP family protein refolding chaperone